MDKVKEDDPKPPSALNVNERVLQCFWELASQDEAARLRASRQLVADLLEDQKTHGKLQEGGSSGGSDHQQLPKHKQLEHALRRCSPIMTYSLRRLARGLGSSRAASRQGFASAMASLLSALEAQHSKEGKKAQANGQNDGCGVLGVGDAMVLLEHCLEAAGSGKGDIRDALLGRVFGLGAIVRAGLVRTAPSAAVIATSLFSVANKKAFLREAAVCVVLEMLLGGPAAATGGSSNGEKKGKKARDGAGRWLEEGALVQLLGAGPGGCEALRKFLECRPQDATPEALLLALCLWPHLPPDLLASSPLPKGVPPPPPGFLHAPEAVPRDKVKGPASGLFSRAYLQQVLPALQATTSASPRLHTLWNHLLPFLLPGFRPHKTKDAESGEADASANGISAPDASHLEAFWGVVVEEGLFTSSHERKFLGFQLFQVILPRLPASAATAVFSKNFSHTLVLNLRKPDNYLHAMAKRVMDRANTFLEKCPDSAAKLSVSAALQRLGGLNYEQQAKAKATAKLIQSMDEEGVHAYLEQYMQSFLSGSAAIGGDTANQPLPAQGGKRKRAASKDGEGSEDDEEGGSGSEQGADGADEGMLACEKRRAYALDQLVSATRFPTITDEGRLKVLRFLATNAFFAPSEAAFQRPLQQQQQQQQRPTEASAKKSKRQSSNKDTTVAGSLPHELALAVEAQRSGAAPLSEASRRHCAQRLVSLAANAPAAHHRAQQQSEGTHAGSSPSNKKQKVAPGVSASPPAQPSDPARLLGPTLACVQQLMDDPAAQLATQNSEDADTTLAMLQELASALKPVSVQHHQPQLQQSQQPARARAFLHLVQLLQLHVLGDPANAPESSLIFDLRRVVKEAVGVQLPDLEEEVVGGSDDEGEGSESEQEDGQRERGSQGAAEGKPAWSETLLDVLLSLLSRPSAPLPSAPLRGACEAVWRVTCEALTLTGMQDLLRVVTAGDEKARAEEGDDLFEGSEGEEEELEMGGGGDDEDDEEDDGTEQDKGEKKGGQRPGQAAAATATSRQKNGRASKGGSDAGSGDESSADSDEDDDSSGDGGDESGSESEEEEDGNSRRGAQTGAGSSVRAQGGSSNGAGRGNADDEEEEEEEDSDEGMDDDQMFRMDDKIAAYLRATMDKRQGAKEAAAALVALKFRALALLETYARKAPSTSVLLVAYVPLLRALAHASQHPTAGGSSNAVLADRLRGVLLKAMCKARPTYNPSVLPADLASEAATLASAAPSGSNTKRPASEKKQAAAAAAAVANGATLRGALKTALFIASRARDRSVAQAGGSVYAILLRAAHSSSSPTAIELAEASYAAAVTDYLRKKKSKLQHGSLLECVAKAPGLASAAQPLGVVAKEAGGTARNAYIQAKALELLLAHVRTLATTASTPTAPAPQATPASPASSTPCAPSAAAALKPQMKAISSALVAAVAGVGMKAEHQADALKAAVGIVEAIKRLHPSSKLGEVMGPERINLVAKAVSTVRDLGTPDRVGAQLSRLSQVLSITDLLAKTQPDPALRAKISKARAQQAEAKQQQQQQQQQQKGQKGKEQGKKQQGAGKGKGGKQDGDKMQSKGKQGGRTKQDKKVGKEQTGGKVSKKQQREDLAAKQDVNAAKKPRKA